MKKIEIYILKFIKYGPLLITLFALTVTISIIYNEKQRELKKEKIKNGKIKILIYDTGGGIELEAMEKVFIPYFTTKHQSQGTGLGLYIVDKIIRTKYNGSIEVSNKKFMYEDKPYLGACFKILLS